MKRAIADVVVARAGGVCEVMCAPGCVYEAQQLHHRKISGREHAVANLLHICHVCHGWVHAHPKLAYAHGFLVRMGIDYCEAPVLYRRSKNVLLQPDGGLELFS